jgi:hypothetical protein
VYCVARITLLVTAIPSPHHPPLDNTTQHNNNNGIEIDNTPLRLHLAMLPKRALLLAAAALTFFGTRFAPRFILFADSFAWNTAALFALLYFSLVVWNVFVYPLALTPLRHLPQPPVSLHLPSLGNK